MAIVGRRGCKATGRLTSTVGGLDQINIMHDQAIRCSSDQYING